MIAAFGAFEIDLDRVEIRRDGDIVAVQPQVFDVVQYLIEHRDRVVAKEELLDNVWGDRFVSESALTSRIKSARRALGDDGATQHVIRTVHGRGYRFVAALTDAVADRAAPSTDTSPVDRPQWPMVGRDECFHRLVRSLEQERGGVVTGPDRTGRTTLADAIADECAARGLPVTRLSGATGSREIPLSGIAHLLPPDTFEVVSAGGALPDDLARSAIWQEARRSLLEQQPAGPRVMVIDDVEQLDDLSHSLLASLATAGEIVPLVTVRAGSFDDRFVELARHGRLELVELTPLDDADVDALLFRRLGGAVELASLERLVDVSRGVPGTLVDIVEASLAADVLIREEGVWRLVGAPVTRRSVEWPSPGLSAEAIDAAGRLALLGSVPTPIGFELVGDAELDELDRSRLIALAGNGDEAWISIADPLLAAAIVDGISPLRRRAWIDEMTGALAGRRKPPAVLATIADWHPSAAVVTPDELVEGAMTAVLDGDFAVAERLIRDLDLAQHPGVDVIEAEVATGLGQFERAARAIDRVDLDRLDELPALMALRRRATLDFVHAGRHDDALDDLREETSTRDGHAAEALAARLLSLLVAAHRYDDVDALAGRLGHVGGYAGLEIRVAAAWAGAGRGHFEPSLDATDAVLRELDGVPSMHAAEIRDNALVLHGSSLQQVGRLDEAARLARSASPSGRISRLGFFPAVAADIELSAGRARSAREILRSATTAWVRTRHPEFVGVISVMAARCELALGNLATAREHAHSARSAIDAGTGAARSRTIAWLIEIEGELGLEPVETAEVLAASAARGALLSESELRCAIVSTDPTGDEARRHLDRIESATASFDGALWPIRVAEVRARAENRPLDEFVSAYRRLGYERLALAASRTG